MINIDMHANGDRLCEILWFFFLMALVFNFTAVSKLKIKYIIT